MGLWVGLGLETFQTAFRGLVGRTVLSAGTRASPWDDTPYVQAQICWFCRSLIVKQHKAVSSPTTQTRLMKQGVSPERRTRSLLYGHSETACVALGRHTLRKGANLLALPFVYVFSDGLWFLVK